MNSLIKSGMLLSIMLLTSDSLSAQKKNRENNDQLKTEKKMQHVLIDKLTVPVNAKEQFIQRMNINRNIIKHLPGFLRDEVYQRSDENGNLIFITVAIWERPELLKKAKDAVSAEYKETDFNLTEFLQKLNIKIERDIYQPMED